MPNKTIYVSNSELWQQVKDYAWLKRTSVSAVIETALTEYLNKESNATLERITRELQEIRKDLK